MRGKRGLIMGVANDHSIAWGIAEALAGEGADLAFTYQGEALGKRVSPLADQPRLRARPGRRCEVEDVSSLDTLFSTIAADWGSLDFLVHCIGFSDRNELKGRYADTSGDNFVRTMVISAFSFTEIVRRAAELMPSGGAMLTLTFGGSTRVMPNYNVMGIAKAALEASVRYLAADFGPEQHPRQHHLRRSDPHPCRGQASPTRNSCSTSSARIAPLRRSVTIENVGGDAALYLLSSLSDGVTGEVHFVDAGYNIVSMPRPNEMND